MNHNPEAVEKMAEYLCQAWQPGIVCPDGLESEGLTAWQDLAVAVLNAIMTYGPFAIMDGTADLGGGNAEAPQGN